MPSSRESNLLKLVHADRRSLILAAVLLLALAAYFAGVPRNPPGFFVDESSIAFNAHTISRGGADEHGERWPLFFRAFGEYKSPVYIYLLAALYRLTGPSIFVARALSAVAGAAAALLVGLVALRSARRLRAGARDEGGSHSGGDGLDERSARASGLAVAVSALLTPWLFEVSRLVFEVALMPLALALFLLAVEAASREGRWSWRDSARVASALALATYAYSLGRVLAPLLAFGLVLFVGRGGWWRVALRTWLFYGVAVLPIVAFALLHPGALGERFWQVSYLKPETPWAEIVVRFVRTYMGSFDPWMWLVAGDPEPRHHLPVMGSLLAATAVSAALGLVLVLRRYGRDAWWRFVLYGLLVSPVATALTVDRFHTLRLVALPVFLLLLGVPAWCWLLRAGARPRLRRAAFVAILLFALMQGAFFLWHFRRAAPSRGASFDAGYPEVFDAALSQPQRPIYLIDGYGTSGYIHAYWYATLRGSDTRQFVRFPREARPPSGALVISSRVPCANCRMISERNSFRAYFAE